MAHSNIFDMSDKNT